MTALLLAALAGFLTVRAHQMWGEERLVQALLRLRRLSAIELVRNLVAEVRAFEGESGPADDITVLVARRPG